MKNRFRKVDIIIPPNTVVPTEWRPFWPAPWATISGTTPNMNAKEVIKIGRRRIRAAATVASTSGRRSEEHTSELQSRLHLVCRLLLEKKKNKIGTEDASDS